ncbi:CDP-diacylglycerol--glycerol-3-phosphate 3-phosphatidyltransferase [Gammaproteobacteria bacterium]|jgi:CDP-diacylglycerol--glycerol-3-phosphate 3-phosphatidyltransferase|nr:CDP-diacylglycerol--glycerol-3-phosphate 3-phosphatidyltransferase [Gammaproteobacteria bacterium]|tara:strand:+ start:920 stop:1453 length:534 start_codon:yes stop_codon:yes gene_type:complete
MTNFINFITIARIFLAPIILVFLIFGNYLVCVLLFFLAGLTDYYDGYLARKYNAESELGEILDPIADKILIVFILIGLSVELDSQLMALLSSLIIAREIGVAALRDYSARNNLSDRTKVTFLAKAKTSIQLLTIGLYLLALAISFNLLIVISDIFLIIATFITLYTGYQYTLNVFKK